MESVFVIHKTFGEMILPVLIVAAAIYLTVTYKEVPAPSMIRRAFPILVDLQVGLGIILWILRLINLPSTNAYYLGFPFILHPLLGLIAAGLGHMSVGARNPMRTLGRWAPLASLAVLLLLVISNVLIATRR